MAATRRDRSRRRSRCALVALGGMLLCGLSGCESTEPRRIVFVGDSITQGIHDGRRVDAQGGFPGRLQRRIGDRAVIVNRGIGGFSTRQWLAGSADGDWTPYWDLLRQIHPSAGFSPKPPAGSESLVEAMLRESRPDATIILLGANDMVLAPVNGDPPVRSDAFVERFIERLREIAGIARRFSDTVVVATILPSVRDPDDVRRRLNQRIRSEFPDALPLGEQFEQGAWQALLSDNIHPSPAGYDRLAALLEPELERRHLLAPREGPTSADGAAPEPALTPLAGAAPTEGA